MTMPPAPAENSPSDHRASVGRRHARLAEHSNSARSRLVALALAAAVASVTVWCPMAKAAEERTLRLHNLNTDERLVVTYWRDGRYDEEGVRRLEWFMRDWRDGQPIDMDPRLFDALWSVYAKSESREPIEIHSGYRSARTNRMLRRRDRTVAAYSQHVLGKAIDFHLPDVPARRLRELALREQMGGVGFYPHTSNPFIHIDIGDVRHWPRMSRSQLARVFPDGRTVHVPSDGKPLARYAEAKAALAMPIPPVPIPASVAREDPPKQDGGIVRRLASRLGFGGRSTTLSSQGSALTVRADIGRDGRIALPSPNGLRPAGPTGRSPFSHLGIEDDPDEAGVALAYASNAAILGPLHATRRGPTSMAAARTPPRRRYVLSDLWTAGVMTAPAVSGIEMFGRGGPVIEAFEGRAVRPVVPRSIERIPAVPYELVVPVRSGSRERRLPPGSCLHRRRPDAIPCRTGIGMDDAMTK